MIIKNYIKAKRTLKKLTDQQIDFIHKKNDFRPQKKFTKKLKPRKMVKFFHPICAYGFLEEKVIGASTRSPFGPNLAYWILGFIILLALSAKYFLSLNIHGIIAVVLGVVGVLAIPIVFFTILNSIFKIVLASQLKTQVYSSIIMFVYPLLISIANVANKDKKISIHLNPHDPTQDNTNLLGEEEPVVSARGYKNEQIKSYKSNYMYGKSTLIDDTILKWKIKEHVKKITGIVIGQRSRRTKNKTKLKIKHTFILEMAFPKSRYELIPHLESQYQGILKETSNFYIIKKDWTQKSDVKFTNARKGYEFDRNIKLDPFFLEMKRMYRCVNPK